MEEDFYATLKLKTGEEIFAKVMPVEENSKLLLLVTNPIVVTELKSRTGIQGYKVEPWLKTSDDDLLIINLDDVLTMSESQNIEMIMLHQQFTRKMSNMKSSKPNISRKMGYISSVNEAKELLEKLFKNN